MVSSGRGAASSWTLPTLLVAGAVASGCQTQPEVQYAAPIDASALTEIQTVGVAASPNCIRKGQLPQVAEGAAEGAGYGAGQGAQAGLLPVAFGCGVIPPPESAPLCVVGIALSAVAVPVLTIVGTVGGAINASSAEEVDAAEVAMQKAVGEFEVVGTLEKSIAESGNAMTSTHFSVCGEENEAQSCAGTDNARPDAVVVVRRLMLEFPAQRELSPDFPVLMTVDACVTRQPDAAELYAGRWRYMGPKRDFFEAADDDAKLLRSELSQAVDAVGEAMVRDAFVGPPQPISSPKSIEESIRDQRPGTVLLIEAPLGVRPKE